MKNKSHNLLLSRTFQYLGIILIVGVIGGGYWYYKQAHAGVNLQSSQEGMLTNGLVGYWPFDGNDISGATAYDRSGSGNNGTLTNGPTKTEGKVGQGISFDGTNQHVSMAGSSSVQSVSYWTKGSDQVDGGIELNANQFINANEPFGWTSPTVYVDGLPKTASYGSDVVVNGNFAANVTGWTTNSSPITWQNAVSGDGSTGYLRFQVDNNGNWDRFRHDTNIISASTSYRVSFWYRTSGVTGNMQTYFTSDFSTLANSVLGPSITPSASWQYVSYIQTSTSASYPVFAIAKIGNIGAGSFDIDAISVKPVSSLMVTDADWHHVVVTTGTAITASAVKIGKSGLSYSNNMIDEPRIYNRALSQSEITALYQAGVADNFNSADSQADPLEKGLVGYWKLDDASGTSATDSSGNANTGTLTNGPTWTTGRIGGAASFDGSNDYIDAGTGSTLNVGGTNLTISAWVKKTTSTDGVMDFVNRGQGGVGGYNLGIGVNTCGAHSIAVPKLGMSNICAGSFPQDTNWHHVVAVWNSTGEIVYVDGAVSGTNTNTQSFNTSYSGSLKIGMDYDGTSNPIKGSIDEVRVYNRALSGDEVAKLYRTTAPDNPDTGLVGYWSFNGKDLSGTTAYDRSGKGNTGTLTNGPTVTEGKAGQALNFNGTNQYARITRTTNLEPTAYVSASMWIKVTSPPGQFKYLLSKGAQFAGSPNYGFFDNVSGDLQFIMGGYYSPAATASSIFNNEWHHIAGVYDGSYVRLYVDGVEVGSGTAHSGAIPVNAADLFVGSYDASSGYYPGIFDEPRIYNRALSASEIWNLYQAGDPDKVNSSDSQVDSLEKGIVGYWKLDDASGASAVDSSGNANTGTLTNGPTWTTGQVGGATTFDGTNDSITMASAATTVVNNYTMSAWVYPANINQAGIAILNGLDDSSNVSQRGYAIGLGNGTGSAGGKLQGLLSNVAFLDSGFTFPSANNWYHIVMLRDNGTTKFYVNGVQTTNTFATAPGTPSTGFSIGSATGVRYFSGSIDEVRIYNRALTAEEVAKLYKTTAPDNPDTSLVGYWPFNGKDLSGITAYDRSGKGNTGTLTNGPTVTEGKAGQALNFNGTSTYVSMPYAGTDFERTDPFSFSVWAKPESFIPSGGFQTFIGRYTTGPNRGTFFSWCKNAVTNECNANSIMLLLYGSNGGSALSISTATNSFIPPTEWAHIVTTYDGSATPGGVRIYINGASMSLTTMYNSNFGSGTIKTGTNWRIGDDSTNDFAKGSIDEVRIYNRVLTQAEVTALYNAGR